MVKIEIPKSNTVRAIVPGHVFRQPAFKWQPEAFMVEHEKYDNKMIDDDVQLNSLRSFTDDPTQPVIYGVTGNPDDQMAKYFAGYLAHLYSLKSRKRIVWASLYGNFQNPWVNEPVDAGLMIITNLTKESTQVKLEKARDILDRYADIPRIVVAAGTDPISFLAMRLYSPIHSIAYLASKSLKTEVV